MANVDDLTGALLRKKSRELFRSLLVVKDTKAGGTLTEENACSVRPGYGLPLKYYDIVLGKKVKTNIEKGTTLKWVLF
jgi:N-acetylneuraminate synthase